MIEKLKDKEIFEFVLLMVIDLDCLANVESSVYTFDSTQCAQHCKSKRSLINMGADATKSARRLESRKNIT